MTTAFAKPNCRTLAVLLWCLLGSSLVQGAEPPTPPMTLEVDARDLPRALLHARLTYQVAPGPLVLWFPKWIPGTHAPCGPEQNLAGLHFATAAGVEIPWRRDPKELYRFQIEIPPGTASLVVQLDYICNQPSPLSAPVDSYGNELLGAVNWNTVLLYPEGAKIDEVKCAARIQLPAGWQESCALARQGNEAEAESFAPVTLRTLVDSPLICGAHLRTLDLTPTAPAGSHAFLHVVTETEAALQIGGTRYVKFQRLLSEAGTYFGAPPAPEYHFLAVCSNTLAHGQLGHRGSSLVFLKSRELTDDHELSVSAAVPICRELVRAWMGGARRVEGEYRSDFHTPCETSLAWVGEGFAQHVGEVLATRAGFLTSKEYLALLAERLSRLQASPGRGWRSLQDLSSALAQGSQAGKAWSTLRRDEELEAESSLLWLEADAHLLAESGNARSLETFARIFFGPLASAQPAYTLPDLVATLNGVHPLDWAELFRERSQQVQPKVATDFLKLVGYRLQYTAAPAPYFTAREAASAETWAWPSLGCNVAADGKITFVAAESPAALAGLVAGNSLVAVNGHSFKPARLQEAIADSVQRGQVELVVTDGDRIFPVTLKYQLGPRYLELTPLPGYEELLAASLLQPRMPPAAH